MCGGEATVLQSPLWCLIRWDGSISYTVVIVHNSFNLCPHLLLMPHCEEMMNTRLSIYWWRSRLGGGLQAYNTRGSLEPVFSLSSSPVVWINPIDGPSESVERPRSRRQYYFVPRRSICQLDKLFQEMIQSACLCGCFYNGRSVKHCSLLL